MNHRLRWIFLLVGAGLFSGCGLLYTNIYVPYEYRSSTPADVHSDKSDPEVTGQACSTSLLYLVFWGNGGYAAATHKALEAYPGDSLYDAKVDVKVSSYLMGLYARSCTVVTARAAKP